MRTTVRASSAEIRTDGHHLVVVGPDVFATYELPSRGELLVGRDPAADVQLQDELASREHVKLMVEGRQYRVQDLGSRNGTRVRGQTVDARSPVDVAIGDPILIGTTVLMVQDGQPVRRPLRLLPHGYFAIRLDESCDQGDETRVPCSVVRLEFDQHRPKEQLLEYMREALPASAILGLYAGEESLELLLPGRGAGEARGVVKDLERLLASYKITFKNGIASYPEDGRSGAALIEVACTRLAGQDAAAMQVLDGVILLDDKMLRLYEEASLFAQGDLSILISGETGSGKEILARSIHQFSPRADKNFVAINCANLGEQLLDSELFGYEKGAFTDAKASKAGLLEEADGGTMFLDEIGEMPLPIQAKLLRVIAEKRFRRLGATQEKAVDVRFVSATNRDLLAQCDRGAFRQDLYFRLGETTLAIPPLRERPREILQLARAFAEAEAVKLGRPAPSFAPEVDKLFQQYAWPGNVRELKAIIRRAVTLSRSGVIELSHLPLDAMQMAISPGRSSPLEVRYQSTAKPSDAPLDLTPAEQEERARIVAILDKYAGNQSRAHKELNMSRGTLVARMARYRIPRPRS